AAEKANAELTTQLNPASLEVLKGCKVEPMLASPVEGARYQFERLGYFAADPDTREGAPVFNRTVSLKDSFKP
ncbi:MAG: glutamyl-tRNA synthetase, partial [Acidobacteriota bacterium]